MICTCESDKGSKKGDAQKKKKYVVTELPIDDEKYYSGFRMVGNGKEWT